MDACRQSYYVDDKYVSFRIDQFISSVCGVSRARIEDFIKNRSILINDRLVLKKSLKVKVGDVIHILDLKEEKKIGIVDISVIYENANFLIINKPAFVYSCDRYENDPVYSVSCFAKEYWRGSGGQDCRFGVVHRLDRDTSGLMVIAKNDETFYALKILFQERQIKKKYIAFTTLADIPLYGVVDVGIMRDPCCPIQMTWSIGQGKAAMTQYEIIAKYNDYMKLNCFPFTGRTHQIRVHLKYMGCFLLGDSLYGRSSKLISRQALHAESLQFTIYGQEYFFQVDLPEDMKNL